MGRGPESKIGDFDLTKRDPILELLRPKPIGSIGIPTRDHTLTIHDDLPDEVPADWGCKAIRTAIEEVVESIIQREFVFDGKRGHAIRIANEKDWERKLRAAYKAKGC